MKVKAMILLIMLAAHCSGFADPGLFSRQVVDPGYMKPADTRVFQIEYVAEVPEVPAGTKKLRVWVPVPADSTVQTIRALSFSTAPRLTVEPKYGNRIAFWELDSPPSSVKLSMTFICERREVLMDLAKLGDESAETSGAVPFLVPDRLVTVDDEIRALARKITMGRVGSLEKARAIYEYVLEKMTYDKNHGGWGLGSTQHACEVGKGNCTDFHALFNSLCRAEGIASGFEIGLYLPYQQGQGEALGGYHCWAFFRVPGKTWVPVDCSEADRFPERREYFFGGHTPNRVTLSAGRDIVLEPAQNSEPLNYFLDPHAEADGEPVRTTKSWSFRDLR